MVEWKAEEEFLIFNEGQIDFEFNLDVEYVQGLEKVEDRVEDRMNSIIQEELERVCFQCGSDKLMQQDLSYYCPKCEDND